MMSKSINAGRKLVKTMNNMKIYKHPFYKYQVAAPNGTILEDRLTLAQAMNFARTTKDFVKVKTLRGGKPTLKDLNNALKAKGKRTMEATRHKGRFYVLHICKNNVPVPLFMSKDSKEVLDYIEGAL